MTDNAQPFAALRRVAALPDLTADDMVSVRKADLAELLHGFDSYVLQAQIDGSDAYDPDYDVAAEKKRLWG